MNAYLTIAGVLVGLEVLVVVAVIVLVIIAARADKTQRQAAREADETVATVSSWRNDENKIADEAEAWLRDGGLQ